MRNLLNNRAAVVTGAASGIGRAIALEFAAEGADVVVADLRDEPREGGVPTHNRITDETNRDATFVECDVRRPSDLERAVAAAADFGGIDAMVNNAGVFRMQKFINTDENDYDLVMDTNAKGAYFGTQAAARQMVERGDGGSIVNLSSTAGLYGVGDYVAYSMSKGATRLLTYAAADALGPHNVRVNVVHPGVIETQMTREDSEVIDTDRGDAFREHVALNDLGTTEDIAAAVLYLVSDLSSYVTAESLVVDGGVHNTG